ncbi:unnamed protein product [Ilex paraguariensis]|uniref:AB hydrolase-1 domain-containing protein n=1 Tax=Ilex paraguariensis TaxID=185542 RepID=A0ABC8RND2_9AQUA
MDAMSECRVGLVEALNTRVYGNGTQTLVLSHGFGCDQTVWHYLIPVLAYYFRVVVFDLVFSSKVDPKLYDAQRYSDFSSYAQDLTSILDKLHLQKTIFLGHSMSAMIGCIAATERPDLFEHLILLSGSPRYLNTEGYYGGFNRSELDTILSNIQHNYSGWIKAFAPQAVGVKNTAAVAEFEHSLGRMKPEIVLSVAKTVYLSDERRVLPRVHVPSTIILSEEDIVAPLSVAFYMKGRLGAPARIKILKTKGHFPQLSAPSQLLLVLKKVLHFDA